MVFVNDRISDFLTRIRNGYNAKLLSVTVLYSKTIINILSILQRLGYIRSFKVLNNYEILVNLIYYRNQPGIRQIYRISKLSNRVYFTSGDIMKRMSKSTNTNGFFVLSTNKGILLDIEASLLNVGGEVLFEVY